MVEQNCVGTSLDKAVPDVKIPFHVPWIRQQNSVVLPTGKGGIGGPPDSGDKVVMLETTEHSL